MRPERRTIRHKIPANQALKKVGCRIVADDEAKGETRRGAIAALRRASSSPCSRSSSCAQVAARQRTVTTPSRSRTGCAWLAIRSPALDPQTLCTAASKVAGSLATRALRMAAPIERGLLRGLTPPLAARRRRAAVRRCRGQGSAAPNRDLVALAGAREVLRLGRGDQRLPAAGREPLHQQFAVLGVELAGDVVEQHQGRGGRRRAGRGARRTAAPAAPRVAGPASRSGAASDRPSRGKARRGEGPNRCSRERDRPPGARGARPSASGSSASLRGR